MSMWIDPANIAFYLVERRLLSLASVVAGDFVVVDQSSRNRNLKVIRHRSPGFFVKQAARFSPELTRSLAREAACYRLAAARRGFAGIAGIAGDAAMGGAGALVPRCHLFDPVNMILVLELLPNAESLWEHHLSVGSFPVEIALLQGSVLGAFHRQGEVAAADLAEPEVFDRRLPWILSIHETNPKYLGQMSLGSSQLLQILRDHPELPAALDEVKRCWVYRTVIHGDVKWENLVLTRSAAGEAPELRVIDWEMADIGDPCWDAGAVFQAYLSFWVFSLPLAAGVSVAEAAEGAPFTLSQMPPALAAFWSSYAAARRLPATESQAQLVRSMTCAAARMIQTAYEGIQRTPRITPQALCQLQMSMNILRDPAAAVRDFVGIDAGAGA
jgi:hypothetical protein